MTPAADEPIERMLLRDGSVARVRPSDPADFDLLEQFFRRQSAESRRRRFFAAGQPTRQLLERFCDSSQPSQCLTLIAIRTLDGEVSIIGTGTYVRTTPTSAEVAFAVDEPFQGHGIATALLERLGVAAWRQGLTTFRATTLPDNGAMLRVFRDSGFQERSSTSRDSVDVELSLAPTEASVWAAEARERANATASITPLLRPRNIAVVGVSRQATKVGRRAFDQLRAAGFHGGIHPINPGATEIAGVPAYPSVSAAPGPIDLAVIAVPAPAVPAAIADCASAGVRALVVLTAGFAETGDAGRRLQQQMTDAVRAHGMRMVGPNCLGVVNAEASVSMNASFSPVFPHAGNLALSSQSGALGIVILALANQRGVGISQFVSVGNRADVSSNDLMQFWETDPHTSVIALYLESFGNPRRFARLCRRIGRRKPIVAVKAGRTQAGSRAAGSHTAAMAATDVAVDALFRQTGVIRADTIDEMFDLAACLGAQPLPPGRRVGIVSNAGGPGILAADACDAAGLVVVDLSPSTRAALSAFLPADASVGNPVDMVAGAGADEYRRAVEIVLAADEVDTLVVLYTPVDPAGAEGVCSAIEQGVVAARSRGATAKAVAACVLASAEHPTLRAGAEQIPVYAFPEAIARALGKIANYAEWRAAPPATFWQFDDVDLGEVRAICRAAVAARGSTWLSEDETARVLQASRLPAARTILATSAEAAVAAAAEFAGPVAAKLVSRAAIHKSDLGGIRLNLATPDAVADAYGALVEIARQHALPLDGVAIQPMIPPGVETMVGVVQDRLFGALVGFGLGGTEVELLGDVKFRIAPLADRDVDQLIAETRAARLLSGFRSRPAADVDALRELLFRVSWLADEVPEIRELDFNPVIVGPVGHGCTIADARINVGPPAR